MRAEAKKPIKSRKTGAKLYAVRPESRSSRSPVLQALRFIAAFQKCRPTGRHFSSFSPGAPSRMGRARWREQGGGGPLGAGGIHFRRAGPIPTGVPKGPALWGEKEVRPESRSSRSPVLQALSFSVALQKCRPTGRHFSSFSPGAPSRMGRARWREQGGGVPLGAGGIHFRRAGPIPTGVPKGPALWGRKKCDLKAARRAPQFSKR